MQIVAHTRWGKFHNRELDTAATFQGILGQLLSLP